MKQRAEVASSAPEIHWCPQQSIGDEQDTELSLQSPLRTVARAGQGALLFSGGRCQMCEWHHQPNQVRARSRSGQDWVKVREGSGKGRGQTIIS